MRHDPPHLWIVGGLSGAGQSCLLVWLSYQCRLGSRAEIGKLCGQSSPPAGRILLTAKVGSLAILAAIRRDSSRSAMLGL